MSLTVEQRAAETMNLLGAALESLAPQTADNLTRGIATAIGRATEEERARVHDTLRLCMAAFDEVLAAPDVPGHIRASVRVCRALCKDALGEATDDNPPA
jgi:hypothetical protein